MGKKREKFNEYWMKKYLKNVCFVAENNSIEKFQVSDSKALKNLMLFGSKTQKNCRFLILMLQPWKISCF